MTASRKSLAQSLAPVFVVALAACGGPDASSPSSGSSSSGGEALAGPSGQTVQASFVAEALPPDGSDVERARVALVLRDEAGATVRAELGTFMGCSEAAPRENTLLSLQCYWAGAGDALHLTRVGDELVVLRQDLAEELQDAPRVPVRRVSLSAGARVDVAP